MNSMGCWFLRPMLWLWRMRFCGCTVPQTCAESSVNKRRKQCSATPGSAQGCGWKLCFSTYWPERSDSKPVGFSPRGKLSDCHAEIPRQDLVVDPENKTRRRAISHRGRVRSARAPTYSEA